MWLAVLHVCSSAAVAESQVGPMGDLYATRVAASAQPKVAASGYKLWVPEECPVVRTLFVINMRAAGKRVFFADVAWRQLAADNHAAMMFCEFEAMGVRDNGYGASMLKACEQFAVELQRPELKHAPFVLWGHSMGGRVVQDFVRFRPGRVLAFHIALRGNPTPPERMTEPAAAMSVPGLYLMGELDGKPRDIREHFRTARRQQAPRAWVWLPGQTHWPRGMDFQQDHTSLEDWRAWAAHDIVIPWTQDIINRRLPADADPRNQPVKLLPLQIDQGWLGDLQTGLIAVPAAFPANAAEASWFPSERTANAWRRFCFPNQTVTDQGQHAQD